MTTASQIASNVAEVRERIAEAAARSGREPDTVSLVAVTKYVDADQTRMVLQAGCRDLGENRPQQLWDKSTAFADEPSVRWHQIGHLQRNKVARTVPLIHLLHSVDSLRLLASVDQAASTVPRKLPILLEVNVSGDAAKQGWEPSEMTEVVSSALEHSNVEVNGLMTMASLGGSPDVMRRNFSDLRELRDRLQREVGDAASLSELSMGMSNDFEIAIEEGATIVRVGSALFK